MNPLIEKGSYLELTAHLHEMCKNIRALQEKVRNANTNDLLSAQDKAIIKDEAGHYVTIFQQLMESKSIASQIEAAKNLNDRIVGFMDGLFYVHCPKS